MLEQLLSDICALGPRSPGSEAMARARGLLADFWRAIGLREIHEESVACDVWRPGPCAVRIAGGKAAFDVLGCAHSAEGEASGPVRDCRSQPTPPEDGCRGDVVIVSLAVMAPTFPLWRDAAPAAMVLASGHPELARSIGLYSAVSFPVVGVSDSSADLLVATGGEVAVAASGHMEPARCANLIADLGPDEPDGETVLLGAHLDTLDVAPGALDNLSGVMCITEIARRLRERAGAFRRRLRLVAFAAEEQRFDGSRAYVRDHAAELDRLRFALNMDSLSDDTAAGVAAMGAPEVRDVVEDILRESGATPECRSIFCTNSDYMPFLIAGVPAARPAAFHEPLPPWTHTREDTLDKFDWPAIARNADVFAGLIEGLLTRETLPLRRMGRSELRRIAGAEGADLQLAWRLGREDWDANAPDV